MKNKLFDKFYIPTGYFDSIIYTQDELISNMSKFFSTLSKKDQDYENN